MLRPVWTQGQTHSTPCSLLGLVGNWVLFEIWNLGPGFDGDLKCRRTYVYVKSPLRRLLGAGGKAQSASVLFCLSRVLSSEENRLGTWLDLTVINVTALPLICITVLACRFVERGYNGTFLWLQYIIFNFMIDWYRDGLFRGWWELTRQFDLKEQALPVTN